MKSLVSSLITTLYLLQNFEFRVCAERKQWLENGFQNDVLINYEFRTDVNFTKF